MSVACLETDLDAKKSSTHASKNLTRDRNLFSDTRMVMDLTPSAFEGLFDTPAVSLARNDRQRQHRAY